MVSARFKHPQFAERQDISSLNRRRAFTQKIIGRHARFGKRIVLQQTGTVPASPRERELLPKIQEQIHQTRKQKGKGSSGKLERLSAIEKVLRESIQLRKVNGGRDPNVYQVLGKFALMYGLDSQELKKAASAMYTTWVYYHNLVTWDGSPNHISNALRMQIGSGNRNLPSETEKLLHIQQKPLTSKEIALALRLDFIKFGRPLNSSLQFLETAMYVKKLPLMVEPGASSSPFSVWAHRAYKSKINPYELKLGNQTHFKNSQMEILNELHIHQGVCMITELYNRHMGRPSGNPNAIFGPRIIRDAAKSLEKSGMIQSIYVRTILARNEKTGQAQGRTPETGAQRLELTPLGKKFLEQTIKTGIISEELRVLFLGEKEV